jgi:putative NADPH-quinone reductase
MKKVLIINGHPNPDSFCFAIVECYKKNAIEKGLEIKEINISELDFNPNLKFGYQQISELEPSLIESWDKIVWADHLVWVHPVWWGGLPAITKGFIDRVFLPGKAFKFKKDSPWWDKLLKGKTGHIITTMDQPGWFYWLMYGSPSVNQLKKSTLEFCGISPVKVTYFSPIKSSSDVLRKKWLLEVEKFSNKI